MRLSTLFDEEEKSRIVGLGASGGVFARRLAPECAIVPIETIRFDRDRANRVLKVGRLVLPKAPIAIDDVAVSGVTIRSVSAQLSPLTTVGVGMLYKSKRTRRMAGVADLRSGLTYSRNGGGNPPINSVATLQAIPGRLNELAERYFVNNSKDFKQLVGELNA